MTKAHKFFTHKRWV